VQIKFLGIANTAQAKAQFAALTAQVEALNSAIAKTAMMPSGGSPAGFQRTAGAVNAANRAFNSALASSGAYRVEQLKINDAVEKNTNLLKQQKLTMHEVFSKQGRKNMHEVYKDQLRMNNAQAQMIRGGVGDGKTRMTLAVPSHVDESWDTLNNRVGMFGHQLASASKQTVNWGKNMQWAGRQLMVGFTLPVMAFGAAAGIMAFQVDKQLTRIAKVYDTTANANSNSLKEQMSVEKELNSLREAGMKTATDAAHAYGVSITDTLSVQAELAATGQKGAELQANTTDIVRIATLGEIDHAVATKALIALQSTLGLSTKETADAFNYMNSVENATSLSTADFAEAIPRALAPMKEMGGSLKDLSILMVAMKERGIEAGEGANAIKAMMQRVYRPSKQVREEWQQLAGVDLEQIVQSSGGKVMEILPKIAEAIDGMARPEKVKLLAGYFGTYQVTRMSAMLAGISDMNKGIGQTSRVLDVNQQSWQEWSKTADRELKAIQESASGKFKRALEGVKAELAAIGDPFLAVASGFLTAVTKVAAFFNSMPDWVKKGVVFAAILGALIGPVVMLVGLFANFAGNIGLFAATMLKATSSFNLFGKAEWAARKETELARAGFINQASAAEKLKQRIDAVTLALQEQARIMAAVGKVPLPASLQTPVAVRPGMIPSSQMSASPAAQFPFLAEAANSAALGSSMGLRGKEWTRPDYAAGEKKPRKTHNDGSAAAAIRAAKSAQVELNQQAQAETKIRQRTAGLITTTGVATAAMSASMLLMLTTSGETSGEFAKWLMILSIALPLMQGAVPAAKAIALWTAATATSAKTAALAQLAGDGGTMKLAGGLGVARGAAMGLKAAMLAVMGPIGWTVTAVAAIGYAFYKVNQNAKEAYEAQVKSQ
jgi:TP901 family phage tail tape measure protein